MENGTIIYGSTGALTIADSLITAGAYAASGIVISKPTTVSCTGNTSIYANNEGGNNCIDVNSSGITVTLNSSGFFYCTARYVVNSDAYNTKYNIAKGNFVSRQDKYMFSNNGAPLINYASSSGVSNRSFLYINSYNSYTSVTKSNCYYLGVNV